MLIGFVQTSPVNGDVAGNLERAGELIGSTPGADVLVLPELFATGYLHENRLAVAALAEDDGGPTIAWARKQSLRTGAALCGGFILRDGDRLYNAAFLADAGAVLGFYAKAHLFDREKIVFDAGPGPFTSHDLRGVKFGMMICFDWQFPEVARSLALEGAQVILHPSNLVLPFAQEAMRTRCLENGVFAVTANRVGFEKNLRFTGASQIIGSNGEILVRAEAEGECVRIAEIDPAAAQDKKIAEHNDRFGDRRPELYGKLAQR